MVRTGRIHEVCSEGEEPAPERQMLPDAGQGKNEFTHLGGNLYTNKRSVKT